jgi:glucan endo-1,3-alpha-glucosidase
MCLPVLIVGILAIISSRKASASDVFAHFMVQNAWAYNDQQWREDMHSAKSIGIDAFAMNWMPPGCQEDLSWQASRIDDAYRIAKEVGFKIVHSFDMSWTDCKDGGYWNTTYMADVLEKHASSEASYRWQGDMLVTTYGGDRVHQYGNSFFEDLKAKMKLFKTPISFTPALTTYAEKAQTSAKDAAHQMIEDFPSADGYFNWQAWPMNGNVNSTCAIDEAFQDVMIDKGKDGPYIMAVSPWQFKDLDNGNNMDAWVAPSDWIFVDRLEAVAQQKVKPDIIELLTWNDWCESHYLRDLPGNSTSATDYADLSNMKTYVDGQNHSPWRIIAKYYISWWKNGNKPAITKDQVVFWYRVHQRDAECSQGSRKIRNSDLVEDAVFAWAAVTEESKISITLGHNISRNFKADGSRPALGSIFFPKNLNDSGTTPRVTIERNGETIHHGRGSKPITPWCSTKNFNPIVNLVGQGGENRGHD